MDGIYSRLVETICPPYRLKKLHEKYCREGGIFHEKGKNEIFRFEKLENFRGECKLSVWLCQIAKHEYYAWTKKQKRYANKLDENHADQGEDLLNGIINQENGQIIRKILHDLQEPYKEVFMLRVMGEVSYRDIGQLFSKSESWARVTYYRAKKMIVEKMGGAGNDEM